MHCDADLCRCLECVGLHVVQPNLRERKFKLNVIVFFIVIVLTAQLSFAAEMKKSSPADSIHVLKISGEDQKAVIKTPSGQMQIIRVGDVLELAGSAVSVVSGKENKPAGKAGPEKTLTVTEIVEGRVVIEEKTDKGTDTLVISLRNGKQKVQRISKFSGEQRVLQAPKTEVVKGGNSN
jgi:hypothetical protein